jgi:copper chaperone CopZ
METTTLRLDGMNCASCTRQIEDAIQAVSDVGQCYSINFATFQKEQK